MLPPVTVSQNNFQPTKGDLVRRYSCSGIWHSDAVVDSYSNNILTVDCSCGMHFAFEDEENLPEEDFNCACCGKLLINYTKVDDCEFHYDGYTKNQINDIVEELHKNFLSSDENEEDDNNNEI